MSDNYSPVADRAQQRQEKSDGQLHAYIEFKEKNKLFWLWFNLTVILLSVALFVAVHFILKINAESGISCGGLRPVLYCVKIMHLINALICLFFLTGLETKCCTFNLACCLGMFEFGMLVVMQITYFTSQDQYCLSGAPDLYWTMMVNILV